MVSLYFYLGVSLASSICVMTNCYLIECSNLVGLKCLIDLYVEKKKDMIFHHIMVLGMVYYSNQYRDLENINKIASVLLSTEISTVFLILNNLLEKSFVKTVNKVAFVSTFYYYRIYNYSYLILDKHVQNIFYIHSRNNFDYGLIYTGIYGLFILNLYWGNLIFKKCINLLNKNDME